MQAFNRSFVGLLAALLFGLASSSARAEPRPGAPLPAFRVRDLTDRWRTSSELADHARPTFVVAISGESGGEGMRAWLIASHARYPNQQVHHLALVAGDLSRFVPEFIARDQARARSQQRLWSDTWLDLYGDLADRLGLPHGSPVPWVFVLDREGRVVETLHATLDGRGGPAAWAAMDAVLATAGHP